MVHQVNPIRLKCGNSALLFLITGLITLLHGSHSCEGQTVNDQYGLAAGYYARGEYVEAITAFQTIIQRHPNTELAAVSHFFLAESHVQGKDYAKAYPAYQTFLVLIPGHKYCARAQFRMGESAYRLGHIDEAATLLEAFTRAYPEHVLHEFCLPYLGQVRLKRNEPQLAQRAFERALERFPKGEMSNQCRLGLADSLLAQGAMDEAIRFYDFIKTQKDNPFVGEAGLALGKIWFQRSDLKKSRGNLEYAIQNLNSKPKRYETKYWLARCDIEAGNFAKAVSIIQSIVDQPMPSELKAAILFDGAIGSFKADQPETAEKWLVQLQQEWPNTRWAASALEMRVDIAYSQQDWDTALDYVSQFIEEYPNSVDRLKMEDFAGRIYYERNDYDKAIQTFRGLLEKTDPSPTDFSKLNRNVWNYFIGLGYVGKKEFAKACDVLETVKLDQQDPELQSALAIAQATALVGLGRSDESVDHLQKYLELAPSGVHALRARADLAVALTQGEKWSQADLAAKKLVENHLEQEITWATLYYMAESALKREQLELAKDWFSLLSEKGSSEQYQVRGVAGLFWVATKNDRPHLAGALFERLREHYPQSKHTCEAAMARGKYLEDARQYRQAVEMYAFVHTRFENSPLAPTAMIRHGYNLHKVGGQHNLEAAHKILLGYVDDPVSQKGVDEAVYMLAWVCLDLELPAESLAWFERLIAQYPDSPFWVDAAYRVATEMVEQGKLSVAQELLSDALKRDVAAGVMSSVLYLQGQLAAKQKDWLQVQTSMERLSAVTNDPTMLAKAKYWLAESLYRQEEYNVANEILQDLSESDDGIDDSLKPWIRLRLAQCLVHLEQWNRVLKIAKSCSADEAEFVALYEFDFLTGRALSALGKLEDARVAFEKVVNSELGGTTETAAIAQWRIGETYFHQEDYKQAIAAYYRVDSLYSYDRWRAASLIQAGKCQEHLGNWKHAVKLYQQLIKQFPDSEFSIDAKNRLQAALRQAKVNSSNSSR